MQRPRTPGGGVTGVKTAIRLGSAIDRFDPKPAPRFNAYRSPAPLPTVPLPPWPAACQRQPRYPRRPDQQQRPRRRRHASKAPAAWRPRRGR